MVIGNISKQQCARGVAIALTATAILAAAVSVVALGVLCAPATFAFAAFLGTVTLLPLVGVVAVVVTAVTTALAIVLFITASRLGHRRPLDDSDVLDESSDDSEVSYRSCDTPNHSDEDSTEEVREDTPTAKVAPRDIRDLEKTDRKEEVRKTASLLGVSANGEFVKLLNGLFLGGSRILNRNGMIQIKVGDIDVLVYTTTHKSSCYIYFQDVNDFENGNTDNMLSVEVDKEGGICSVHCNNKELEPEMIFGVTAQTPWAKKLSVLMQHFVEKHAIKVDSGNISVHPFALQYAPEIVLAELCRPKTFSIRNVTYLDNSLEDAGAADAGGPTAQFVTSLARYLFTSCLMTARTTPSNTERLLIKNIGTLFLFCLLNEQPCGRVVEDSYFALIQELFRHTSPMAENEVVEAAKHLITTPEERLLWECWKGVRPCDKEVKRVIRLCELIEDDEEGEKLDGLSNDEIGDLIERELYAEFKVPVLKANLIAQSISLNLQGMSSKLQNQVRALSAVGFSTAVQGMPITRSDILGRISCVSAHPVVLQKVKWLTDFIRDEDQSSEDWIKDFVECVTACRSVIAETVIKIDATDESICGVHTCMKKIDFPITHVDATFDGKAPVGMSAKDKFFGNLRITMEAKGFSAL